MSDEEIDPELAIELYRHYMSVKVSDLLAEYASMRVRDNRRPEFEAALKEAFAARRDEMDDYMITVEER